MKKQLLVGLFFGSMAISSVAVAKPTPIKFAKGSECGTWSGLAKQNKTQFSIYLLAGQLVTINNNYPVHITSHHAKKLYQKDTVSGFRVTNNGNYILTLDTPKGEYIDLKVCAGS